MSNRSAVYAGSRLPVVPLWQKLAVIAVLLGAGVWALWPSLSASGVLSRVSQAASGGGKKQEYSLYIGNQQLEPISSEQMKTALQLVITGNPTVHDAAEKQLTVVFASKTEAREFSPSSQNLLTNPEMWYSPLVYGKLMFTMPEWGEQYFYESGNSNRPAPSILKRSGREVRVGFPTASGPTLIADPWGSFYIVEF